MTSQERTVSIVQEGEWGVNLYSNISMRKTKKPIFWIELGVFWVWAVSGRAAPGDPPACAAFRRKAWYVRPGGLLPVRRGITSITGRRAYHPLSSSPGMGSLGFLDASGASARRRAKAAEKPNLSVTTTNLSISIIAYPCYKSSIFIKSPLRSENTFIVSHILLMPKN